MRPRLITAENPMTDQKEERMENASMRPRLITAENVYLEAIEAGHGAASMRPRLITAENPRPTAPPTRRAARLQ